MIFLQYRPILKWIDYTPFSHYPTADAVNRLRERLLRANQDPVNVTAWSNRGRSLPWSPLIGE
jgi:hypothetical protein